MNILCQPLEGAVLPEDAKEMEGKWGRDKLVDEQTLKVGDRRNAVIQKYTLHL